MYHISDLKKFTRCKRLFLLSQKETVKAPFRRYIRLDEAITDDAVKKLHIQDAFYGERGDEPAKAIDALKNYEWLVKARFEYHSLRVKVPFLHRTLQGYDVYFLFVGLYPHAMDLSFYCDTVWVLLKNRIPVHDIYMIHLNARYKRQGPLDYEQLFVITQYFYNANNHPSVSIQQVIRENLKDVSPMIDEMQRKENEPIEKPVHSTACNGREKCTYYDSCFSLEETENDSILTLVGSQYRYQMKKEGKRRLKDVDVERLEGQRMQYAQIMADRLGGLFFDKLALQTWLKDVTYPIAFLDFEWERFAIPPYDGMHPFDVLPFEYSLHILEENGNLIHKAFLSVHDDRKEMITSLLENIPAKGTIFAYNAEGAEKIRILEMMEQFPKYHEPLMAIFNRFKDLQIPFSDGMVYDVRMKGFYSLKTIMGLFDVPGYHNLEIAQGMEAVYQWRQLDKEEKDVNNKQIQDDLKAYCGMDSYAMTVVYQWLKTLAQ